jgi:hypothetical protein
MKTYKDLVVELEAKGYVPLGRWEHVRKGSAETVLFMWHHAYTPSARPEARNLPDIVVACSTNDAGDANKVIEVYGIQERFG